MKVRLKTNFDVWEKQGEVEMGLQDTLRGLLDHLSAKSHLPIIDPKTGDVDELILVRVNGREHFVLPQRLDTPLHDGDEVGIELIFLAGG